MISSAQLSDLIGAVKTIAKRFRRNDQEDMVSEGMLAILKSRKKYNPAKGSFRLFALHRAFHAMVAWSDLDNLVHVARSVQWQHKRGCYADRRDRAEDIERAKRTPEVLCDVIEDQRQPYEQLEHSEMIARIDAAILLLDERQQLIMDQRYSQGKSAAQVAAQLGLTRQRVHQMESESLSTIRRGLR